MYSSPTTRGYTVTLFKFTDGKTRDYPIDERGIILLPDAGTAETIGYSDDVYLVIGEDRHPLMKSNDARNFQMKIGDMPINGVIVETQKWINITPLPRYFLLENGTYFVLPESGYVPAIVERRFTGKIGETLPLSLVQLSLPEFLTTQPQTTCFVCTWDIAQFANSQGRENFVALNEIPGTPGGPLCSLNGEAVLYRDFERYI